MAYDSPMVAVLLVLFAAVVDAVAVCSRRARSVLIDLGVASVAVDPARLGSVCGDARLRLGLLAGPGLLDWP